MLIGEIEKSAENVIEDWRRDCCKQMPVKV
jgi:hypothetical protein